MVISEMRITKNDMTELTILTVCVEMVKTVNMVTANFNSRRVDQLKIMPLPLDWRL